MGKRIVVEKEMGLSGLECGGKKYFFGCDGQLLPATILRNLAELIPSDQMTLADAIQRHMLWVEVGMLVTQFVGLGGLIAYVRDTRGLRRAAEDQIRVSQDLLRAANDQAEGVSKPCLTIRASLRDSADTILEMGGVIGGMVVDDHSGRYVLVNVGSGVALNVRYRFRTKGDSEQWQTIIGSYFLSISPRQDVPMALRVNAYSAQHEISFQFQSLGGAWYESTVMVENKVLTNFVFKALPRSFNPSEEKIA